MKKMKTLNILTSGMLFLFCAYWIRNTLTFIPWCSFCHASFNDRSYDLTTIKSNFNSYIIQLFLCQDTILWLLIFIKKNWATPKHLLRSACTDGIKIPGWCTKMADIVYTSISNKYKLRKLISSSNLSKHVVTSRLEHRIRKRMSRKALPC